MILIHFSGAFIQINEHRLYDFRVFHIRYDKFVHFINAFIGTIIAFYFFKKNNCELKKFILMMSVFSVLGVGAIIEIAEYIVTLTVEHNGVGSYNNNMLDLIANLFGSLFAIAFVKFFWNENLFRLDTDNK
jgi:uncharacterized membrane protein YjdF